MMRSLAWPALAVSACFNLFFAIGYLRADQTNSPHVVPLSTTTPGTATDDENPAARDTPRRDRGNGSGDRTDRPDDGDRPSRHRGRSDGRESHDQRGALMIVREVTRLLDLDEDQAAVFTELQRGLMEDEQVYANAINIVRSGMKQRLMGFQASPDDPQIADALANELDLIRQRQLARAERFEEFTKVLRPAQVERLRTVMTAADQMRMPTRGSRYDTNGDGRIDRDELVTLRAEMVEQRERRKVERERRRAEALRRFDADGDGVLTDDERERQRRWLLERSLDRNGDGTVDDDERRAGEQWRGRRNRGELDGPRDEDRSRRGRPDRRDAPSDPPADSIVSVPSAGSPSPGPAAAGT